MAIAFGGSYDILVSLCNIICTSLAPLLTVHVAALFECLGRFFYKFIFCSGSTLCSPKAVLFYSLLFQLLPFTYQFH